MELLNGYKTLPNTIEFLRAINLNNLGSQIHIWITQSTANLATLEAHLHPLMSTSEQQRFHSINSRNKQFEYLLSRLLIRHCFNTISRKQNPWKITEQHNNKPSVSPILPNQTFSLSHSCGTICLAFSSTPVGVDIEHMNLKRNMLETAAEFMSKREYESFTKDKRLNPVKFYRTWSQKEAWYKALPTQEQSDFTFKDLDISEQISNTEFSSYHTIYKEHFVSVVAKGKIRKLTLRVARLEEDFTFTDDILPTQWHSTTDG